MAIERNTSIVEFLPDEWGQTIDILVTEGYQCLSLDEAKQLRKELKAAIKKVEDNK